MAVKSLKNRYMPVLDASPFWEPWEKYVPSYSEVHDVIDSIFKDWTADGRLFAWRGVVNAKWSMHSSLYRRLFQDPPLDEDEFRRREKKIMANLHRWGLHNGDRGRLSYLAQLAMLQHFRSPTRLIDVTFNPYIGLWFAVEKKYDKDGNLECENDDGRLFAIDVTRRLINEVDEKRDWEDQLNCPWSEKNPPKDWCTNAFAWRPPPFERRIAAQNGGFLFGGIPNTGTSECPMQWPKATSGGSWWQINEVRSFVSVPIRMHKIDPVAGGVSGEGQPVYTIRISATAKREIRDRLEKLFGYDHSRIYPDYPGFALFGTTDI
jgi:hypothetical protein